MSDSLGGNAKTLMFVNISPADYNCEETQTSLVYASRVKLITNQAKASADTAEVTRLKKVIKNLRNGLPEDAGMEEEAAAAAAPAKEKPAKEEKKKKRNEKPAKEEKKKKR